MGTSQVHISRSLCASWACVCTAVILAEARAESLHVNPAEVPLSNSLTLLSSPSLLYLTPHEINLKTTAKHLAILTVHMEKVRNLLYYNLKQELILKEISSLRTKVVFLRKTVHPFLTMKED